MSEDKGALLGTNVIHDGRVVHLSLDTVRYPDGSVGQLELVRHRGAAAVLPVLGHREDSDPDVLLLRQYRYAAGGVIYEVPAGIVEPGESWEECARRELEEEAGFRAGTLVKLTTIHTTPGFTNEEIHLYGPSILPKAPRAPTRTNSCRWSGCRCPERWSWFARETCPTQSHWSPSFMPCVSCWANRGEWGLRHSRGKPVSPGEDESTAANQCLCRVLVWHASCV